MLLLLLLEFLLLPRLLLLLLLMVMLLLQTPLRSYFLLKSSCLCLMLTMDRLRQFPWAAELHPAQRRRCCRFAVRCRTLRLGRRASSSSLC